MRLQVLAAVMGAMCASGGAQTVVTAQAPPPPPTGMVSGRAGVGSLRGVKGQPYSMVEKRTMVRTLSDGTVITTQSDWREMRDSEGRTRTEIGTTKDGVFELQTVFLEDPVSDTRVTMYVPNKTAQVSHFHPPQPLTPEQRAQMAERRAKAEANGKEHPVTPPTSEDLEPETIAGEYATGWRTTIIIPAGREGNDRDIHVVQDVWSSPDLKINLRSVIDDPRMGKITMEATELNRGEPDPALFQIPADYKISDPTP